MNRITFGLSSPQSGMLIYCDFKVAKALLARAEYWSATHVSRENLLLLTPSKRGVGKTIAPYEGADYDYRSGSIFALNVPRFTRSTVTASWDEKRRAYVIELDRYKLRADRSQRESKAKLKRGRAEQPEQPTDPRYRKPAGPEDMGFIKPSQRHSFAGSGGRIVDVKEEVGVVFTLPNGSRREFEAPLEAAREFYEKWRRHGLGRSAG